MTSTTTKLAARTSTTATKNRRSRFNKEMVLSHTAVMSKTFYAFFASAMPNNLSFKCLYSFKCIESVSMRTRVCVVGLC